MLQPERECFFCGVEHKPRCEVCMDKWCAGVSCKEKRLRNTDKPQPITAWTLSWPPAAKAIGANPSIAGRVHGKLTLSASIVRIDKLRVHCADGLAFDLDGEPADFFSEILVKSGLDGYDPSDPMVEFVEKGILK